LFFFRLKDPTYVINAFNVDPLYLKHDQQGAAPDYRVSHDNTALNGVSCRSKTIISVYF
jgi:hypothetical protein